MAQPISLRSLFKLVLLYIQFNLLQKSVKEKNAGAQKQQFGMATHAAMKLFSCLQVLPLSYRSDIPLGQ